MCFRTSCDHSPGNAYDLEDLRIAKEGNVEQVIEERGFKPRQKGKAQYANNAEEDNILTSLRGSASKPHIF